VRVFLLLLVLTLGTVALPASPASADELMYAGAAEVTYKRRKDSLAARSDAIEAAVADAVRKALPEFMTRETLESNAQRLESELLPTAAALVLRTEIVSEKDRDKTYSVVVRAWIDEGAVADALDSMGISQAVGSRRTIAVVVDEYYAGDSAPSAEPMVSQELEISSVQYGRTDTLDASSSSEVDAGYEADVSARDRVSGTRTTRIDAGDASASDRIGVSGSARYDDNSEAHYTSEADASIEARSEEAYSSFAMKLKTNFPPEALRQPRPDAASAAAIAARLLGRDCRLSDDASVQEMRSALAGPDGILADLVADPAALSSKAATLGAKYGVDAIMVGTTAIVYDGERSGGHSATANLAVRVVDTATGDIVAYAVRNNSGLAADSQSAATSAATRLGDLLGQDLGDQLFAYWKNRDEKGIEISLRIVGIDSTRLNLLVGDLLAGVEGLDRLEQRVFDRESGIAEYVLTTRASPTAFKSAVLRQLYTDAAFGGLEEELSIGSKWIFRVQ
jgi:hypothetical protein